MYNYVSPCHMPILKNPDEGNLTAETLNKIKPKHCTQVWSPGCV